MEYRTEDGRNFTAETYDDLIEAMWKGDEEAPGTLEEWMQQNADHAQAWDNVILRVDTPEHHIKDMLRSGLLHQVAGDGTVL